MEGPPAKRTRRGAIVNVKESIDAEENIEIGERLEVAESVELEEDVEVSEGIQMTESVEQESMRSSIASLPAHASPRITYIAGIPIYWNVRSISDHMKKILHWVLLLGLMYFKLSVILGLAVFS